MLSVPQGGGVNGGGRRTCRPVPAVPGGRGAVHGCGSRRTRGVRPAARPVNERIVCTARWCSSSSWKYSACAGRGLEVHRAVGFDRHRGDDPLDRLRLDGRDRPGPEKRRSSARWNRSWRPAGTPAGTSPCRAAGPARPGRRRRCRTRPAAAGLRSLPGAGPGHQVRLPRRHRARPDRHGVPGVVRALVDQLAVSMHVHQVEAELVRRRRAPRPGSPPRKADTAPM